MQFQPSSRSAPLSPPVRALWLASLLSLLADPGAAAEPAPASAPKVVQRLETPEGRAALTQSLNAAIEQAKTRPPAPSGKPGKPGAVPPVPTLLVQISPRAAPVRSTPARNATPPAGPATGVADPDASRRYIRERAAALAASAPPPPEPPRPPLPEPQHIVWSYEGETGPQAWAQLHPAFAACGAGRQQSPVHISAQDTVTGPAEPLQPGQQAFGGTVLHNGRGMELEPDTPVLLTLRGQPWRVVRLQFRHPAEERVHFKVWPMATDLHLRSAQGQHAVLSVPMQLGAASAFIEQVWTHLPLGPQDRVRLPGSPLQLGTLLPQDLRYFQYLGSLTEPPCTEGVLRLVLQQAATVSPAQWQLLTRMVPPNARPTQPLHGRRVREAR